MGSFESEALLEFFLLYECSVAMAELHLLTEIQAMSHAQVLEQVVDFIYSSCSKWHLVPRENVEHVVRVTAELDTFYSTPPVRCTAYNAINRVQLVQVVCKSCTVE